MRAAVAVLLLMVGCVHADPDAPYAHRFTAYRLCQERISTRFNGPKGGSFPPLDDHAVTVAGDVLTIASYFDQETGRGTRQRVDYTCRLRWSTDDWLLLDIKTAS